MCIFINYTLRILKTLVDNLGVRVAKLEKNADNVKITGNIRAAYRSYSGSAGDKKDPSGSLRSRIYLTGEVNDNWHYVGMLQNEQNLTNATGDEVTRFQRAYLDGNIGAVKLTAGRYSEDLVNGNFYSDRVDGIKLVAGKDVKLTAEYGRMANSVATYDSKGTDPDAGKFWNIGLAGKVGKNFTLGADYISVKDVTVKAKDTDMSVWAVKAAYAANNWNAGIDYINGDSDVAKMHNGSKNGYIVSLGYGAAKASKPGSVGVWAKYYNQPASTFVNNTFNAQGYSKEYGFKGYGVGVDYTVAKNMVAGIQYFDLKDKDGSTDLKRQTLWSQLIVTF